MSESANSSSNRMIWEGPYEDNQKWRDDLTKKASFKSLGITEDMGDIGSHNTTINKGISLRDIIAGAVVSAGLLGSGGAALLVYQSLTEDEKPETVIEKQTDVWDFNIEMEVDRK